MDDLSQSSSKRAAIVLAALGFLAHLALLLLVPYPPLMDLPNHMARHWLAAQALAGAELPPFYAIEYRIIPNLAGDLFMPLVLQVLDLDNAVRLYLSVTLALYWLGPALFLSGQGGTAWSLMPFWTVWLFSGTFFWGFLNFTMGLGLAFLTLAHHDLLSRKGGWLNLLLHTFLVTLLFFFHLVPWAIYGVLLGCKLLWQTWKPEETTSTSRLTPWVQAILFSLPSLVCFVLYRRFAATLPSSSEFDWSPLPQKFVRLLFIFRGYSWIADALTLGIWLIALTLLVLPAIKRGRWHWTHLGLGALIFLSFVIPDRIGAGGELDLRLLPAILVCLLASLASVPPRNLALALGLVVLALALRLGSVGWAWVNISNRLETEAASFAFLQEGDRVLPVILTPEFSKEYPEDAFLAWTVISHRTFIPKLLAYPDQQPLRYTERYAACREPIFQDEATKGKVTLKEELVRRCYNVLWIYDPEKRGVVIPGGFRKVWEEGGVSVWRREGG